MNRNEKGQISPAQSRIAKIMREGQSVGRRVETKVLTKQKRISEAVGRQYKQSQAEPKKREIVARGQQNAYRKSYTKVGARMHKKGLLKAPDERVETSHATSDPWPEARKKIQGLLIKPEKGKEFRRITRYRTSQGKRPLYGAQ